MLLDAGVPCKLQHECFDGLVDLTTTLLLCWRCLSLCLLEEERTEANAP